MKLGTGWLLIEESPHSDIKSLISIISPRKRDSYIRDYMEQLYIDKYATIDERIAYKKNPKSWPYRAHPVTPHFPYVLCCGHDPIFMAYRCFKLKLINEKIEYTFKILKGRTEDSRPIIQENTQVINISKLSEGIIPAVSDWNV